MWSQRVNVSQCVKMCVMCVTMCVMCVTMCVMCNGHVCHKIACLAGGFFGGRGL